MRFIYGLLLLMLLAAGVFWLGGESWMAERVRSQAGAHPGLAVEAVAPLRRHDRIGVRLTRPVYEGDKLGLDLPWLEAWIAPLSPAEARIGLPDKAMLRLNGRRLPLTLRDGGFSLRLSPLHGGAVRQATLNLAALSLDAWLLAEGIFASGQMVGLGHAAPRGARSAFDVDLSLTALDLDALAHLGIAAVSVPGTVSLTGMATLWLDGILDLDSVSGATVPPQPVGLRSEGLDLQLGDARARLAGYLRRSADGRVEGRLAIYTRDGAALLRRASDAGLIPTDAAMLASALINGIGRMPFPENSEEDGLMLPEPIEGELRFPVVMKSGRLFIGDVEIGPAPHFPRAM
ncbi:DUF2125 domain-containing protein [Paracoccus salsus]|uniref:DUF2125 domain-containing protein n=1 Tax=Paracoccus salsus TaxID=2911061 RepID=UPI001F290ADB|nr:DUF2125 domain-containing protein [Paracoccus salsus]MCF3973903.1 DUF2125 domain-containing protein [Paracoccus salsus]